MGYTEQDLMEMKLALNLAVRDTNLSENIKEYLSKANDFIDGLIVEGRI